MAEDAAELLAVEGDLLLAEGQAREPGDMDDLFAADGHDLGDSRMEVRGRFGENLFAGNEKVPNLLRLPHFASGAW